ncbi:hypothetical protein COCOR_07252 [Corallococcus coralloides DSM 2259]|uniref:Lipoprotein n=1 Tax=Corallococcus coralloides (strain ATCC 25202 / DSM 2259 / NBRC 100086 / M2) TaxID=1144275 RepID=H8MJW8_CORCM|nr:hypothetical protein [Corallococcus coralloides]AFE07426.1 hypothetical protein COCOR_07252 [Corallococcus coralloides DSM 2259]
MRPLSRLLLASLTTLALIAGACANQQKTDGSSSGGTGGPSATSTIEDVPNEPVPGEAGGTATGAPAPAFKPYEATEGFSIGMPTEPQVERKQVPLGANTVNTAAFSSRTEDGTIYSVSTADYPERLVASRPPEALLNEGKDGLVKQVQGTIKEESDVTLDGYPGKAYTVSSPVVGEIKARNFLVGPRLYTLLVIYNPNHPNTTADTFLTSLKLVNPPPAVTTATPPDAGTAGDAGTLESTDAGTTTDAGTAAPRRRKAK